MPGTALFFCSASYDIDPKYNEYARQAVRAVCTHGYAVRSGATVKGTMGVICEEGLKCGAYVTGVIPHFMKGLEYPGISSLEWTDTMSERKEKMREGTDLCITLPGGIGTMDEFMETLTLVKLGLYKGRMIVLNVEGFYDPLKKLLDHFVEAKTLDEKSRASVLFPESIEEMEMMI